MSIGIFGGSFNPVHFGHLIMAEEVREEFAFERILFVPAWQSPKKESSSDPGFDHRLAMLDLAIRDNPFFAIDECELRRGGESYTIDTIRQIREVWPGKGEPGLILGDDLAIGFAQWRAPDAVAREADIILARRLPVSPEFAWAHRRASNRLIPIASSDLRSLLERGRSVRYLMPESVREYIIERNLYGSS